MKSLLFVIPWARKFVNNADYTYADSPERAPENIVGLATYLRGKGVRVEIADMSYLLMKSRGRIDDCLDLFWNQCLSFQPDVIGLSFFTARFETASTIVKFLRSKYENHTPLIVAGGIHATLLPDITYQYIDFDALIKEGWCCYQCRSDWANDYEGGSYVAEIGENKPKYGRGWFPVWIVRSDSLFYEV